MPRMGGWQNCRGICRYSQCETNKVELFGSLKWKDIKESLLVSARALSPKSPMPSIRRLVCICYVIVLARYLVHDDGSLKATCGL